MVARVDLRNIMISKGAWTLRTYPLDVVRISCAKCDRAGQYRRAKLIDRFGADMAMPDLLPELAQCPRRENWSDPCMVVYCDRIG
jgi:hypothetical protein